MAETNSDSPKSMETWDVERNEECSGGDAGDCYTITCPQCGGRINWAEHGWWEPVCSCGYEWRVEVSIKAYGNKQ